MESLPLPHVLQDKLGYLVQVVQHCWETSRPVLIGTTNVNESEMVLSVLHHWTDTRYSRKLQHIQLLNAKPENVRTEAQIIAQVGSSGLWSVECGTEMASAWEIHGYLLAAFQQVPQVVVLVMHVR